MLATGARAPDFTLPDSEGQATTLGDLLARGPLVLYFYPADFTPGCTREACSIRDVHGELRRAGLVVAGISPQAPASHQRFRERHGLPFTLLADPDKAVIRRYGVEGPLGWGVRRATFLIDPDRMVVDSLCADLRIGRHTAFVQRAIDRSRAQRGDAAAERQAPRIP